MYALYVFTDHLDVLYFLVYTYDNTSHCYHASTSIKGAFNMLRNSAMSFDPSDCVPLVLLGNFDSYDDVITTAPELLI